MVQSSCQYDVMSRFGDFSKWRANVVDEEDKIIEFLTLILFHFLRFGDVKIPIETENQYNVLILNETFRGVMIF